MVVAHYNLTFLFAGGSNPLGKEFSDNFSFISSVIQSCLWVNARGHQMLLPAKGKTETPVFQAIGVYEQKMRSPSTSEYFFWFCRTYLGISYGHAGNPPLYCREHISIIKPAYISVLYSQAC